MELIRYDIGDDEYVEIEISEELKSKIANERRKTQFDEAEGELAFLRWAVETLEYAGRHACFEEGVSHYAETHFEKAVAAGRNSMRFVQALYRWGDLQYFSSIGEWSLNGSGIRRSDGTNYWLSLWTYPSHAYVEVEKDE